ncbi:hypothetical protein ACEPAI_83 [Sanghuangporus weigelae]
MSHFVEDACSVMELIVPLELADSNDNVGLMLEAQPIERPQNKIFLTIECVDILLSRVPTHPIIFALSNYDNSLTPVAVREAILSQASLIITYRPPITRPLSSLTLADPMQRSLLRLAQAGISVYSPHTALVVTEGGINNWIAEALIGSQTQPNGAANQLTGKVSQDLALRKKVLEHPKEEDSDSDNKDEGRILTLPSPGLKLIEIIEKVKRHLGVNFVHAARPYEKDGRYIRKVAISAGPAGSAFEDIDAHLYITSEMPLDDILTMKARGRFVLLLGLSTAEESYLKELKKKLLSTWDQTPNLAHLDSVQVCSTNKIVVSY